MNIITMHVPMNVK